MTIENGEIKTPEKGECQTKDLLENRTYAVGEAITNYGGYDWHVISDDGTNVTLLMDLGKNGIYKLPSDENLTKDDEDKVSRMAHCPEGTSYCNINGYYTYSWEKSAIAEYLNRNSNKEDFLKDLKSKIGNKIIPARVCNDPSIDVENDGEHSSGGTLVSENSTGCASSSLYNVRLITSGEFYTLRNLENVAEIFKNTITNTMTAVSLRPIFIRPSQQVTACDLGEGCYNIGATFTGIIRPVITVQK